MFCLSINIISMDTYPDIHVDQIIDSTSSKLVCMYMYTCIVRKVNYRLPMAERYEVWVCGRSWVRAPAGAIVKRVFHPTRKLVRFSLLKCPSLPNSKKF